jgi:hypothetical protein
LDAFAAASQFNGSGDRRRFFYRDLSSWCQFHQNFKRSFFCTKVLSQSFFVLNFFGARLLAQMRS